MDSACMERRSCKPPLRLSHDLSFVSPNGWPDRRPFPFARRSAGADQTRARAQALPAPAAVPRRRLRPLDARICFGASGCSPRWRWGNFPVFGGRCSSSCRSGFFSSCGSWTNFWPSRALGILFLLAAEPLLDAAFFRTETSRLLVTVFAYLLIVVGLFWVTMPYLLRDQINWSARTTLALAIDARPRLALRRRDPRLRRHAVLISCSGGRVTAGASMNRILVIRGGAIGDFVLTLPAIKLLRDTFPEGAHRDPRLQTHHGAGREALLRRCDSLDRIRTAGRILSRRIPSFRRSWPITSPASI